MTTGAAPTGRGPAASDHPAPRADLALAAAVLAATVLYLAALPRSLGIADESYFLLESRRLLQGEVLYRDVFYYATPGAHWLMAALFALFGADIAVARLAMAVLHGLTAVLLFASARRLGVQRGLALVVPLAYVALALPAWPYASYHWLSTFLMILLLFVLLGRGRTVAAASWWMRPGLLVGALAAVQQQKGIAIGAGVLALIALDALLLPAQRPRARMARLLRNVAWFAGGVLGVLLPVLAVVLVTAGVAPVWQQLVIYPLTDYRTLNRSGWGEVNLLNVALAQYTVPAVLAVLPALALVSALRAFWLWRAGEALDRVRQLLTLAAVGAAATLSIAYLPDFIHLAFIAPIGLLCASEALAAGTRALARRSPYAAARLGAGAAVVAAVLLASLARNYSRARHDFPLAHQTAFGRVDFAAQQEVDLVERVRDLLRDVPSREFFAYPVYTSLYLTADARNPTPNQVTILGHSSWAQMTQAAEILREHRLPYVLACRWPAAPDDPLRQYIDAAYAPVAPEYAMGAVTCAIMRRRGDVP